MANCHLCYILTYLSLYINPADFRQQDFIVNSNLSFIILKNKLLFLWLICQINSCNLGSVVTQVFVYNLAGSSRSLFQFIFIGSLCVGVAKSVPRYCLGSFLFTVFAKICSIHDYEIFAVITHPILQRKLFTIM